LKTWFTTNGWRVEADKRPGDSSSTHHKTTPQRLNSLQWTLGVTTGDVRVTQYPAMIGDARL